MDKIFELKTYQWDANYRRSGQVRAEEAGPLLESLAEELGERLTTEVVVEAAQPKDSPIHGAFEWDDSLAAMEHRSLQARQLLKSLRVVIAGQEDQEPQRLFLNVRYEDSQAYSTVQHILDDAGLYAVVLRDAVIALKAWQKRYKDLKELKKVHDVIRELA